MLIFPLEMKQKIEGYKGNRLKRNQIWSWGAEAMTCRIDNVPSPIQEKLHS